jgi:hypothetical protein
MKRKSVPHHTRLGRLLFPEVFTYFPDFCVIAGSLFGFVCMIYVTAVLGKLNVPPPWLLFAAFSACVSVAAIFSKELRENQYGYQLSLKSLLQSALAIAFFVALLVIYSADRFQHYSKGIAVMMPFSAFWLLQPIVAIRFLFVNRNAGDR